MADDLPNPLDYARPEKRRLRWNPVYFWIGLLMIVGVYAWSVFRPTLRHNESSPRLACASNLRQIGQGITLYLNDFGGQYPPSLSAVLATQDVTSEIFICPQSADDRLYPHSATMPTTQEMIATDPLASKNHCSYIYVGKGLANQENPEIVVAYESSVHHGGDGGNVLHADGSVTWENRLVIQQIDADRLAGVWPIVVRNPATQKAK